MRDRLGLGHDHWAGRIARHGRRLRSRHGRRLGNGDGHLLGRPVLEPRHREAFVYPLVDATELDAGPGDPSIELREAALHPVGLVLAPLVHGRTESRQAPCALATQDPGVAPDMEAGDLGVDPGRDQLDHEPCPRLDERQRPGRARPRRPPACTAGHDPERAPARHIPGDGAGPGHARSTAGAEACAGRKRALAARTAGRDCGHRHLAYPHRAPVKHRRPRGGGRRPGSGSRRPRPSPCDGRTRAP